MACKRSLYDAGVLKPKVAPLPVVCVGNLTMGGTGKTPMVEHVARALAASGRHPAIVSRGYKRATPQEQLVMVSDGVRILAPAAEGGDEPVLLAHSLPGVPVAVCADRYRACAAVAQTGRCDCIVLDDGFQHWRLARNADFVLVDATADLGRLRPIPAGTLREPLSALRRARAVVHTKAPSPESTLNTTSYYEKNRALAATVAPGVPQFAAIFRADEVIPIERYLQASPIRDGSAPPAADSLRGICLLAFAGIARPAPFFSALRGIASCVHEFAFPDHYSYSESDIQTLVAEARKQGCEAIVTTAKDAIKAAPFAAGTEIPVLVLALRIEMDDEAAFTRLLAESVAHGTSAA